MKIWIAWDALDNEKQEPVKIFSTFMKADTYRFDVMCRPDGLEPFDTVFIEEYELDG